MYFKWVSHESHMGHAVTSVHYPLPFPIVERAIYWAPLGVIHMSSSEGVMEKLPWLGRSDCRGLSFKIVQKHFATKSSENLEFSTKSSEDCRSCGWKLPEIVREKWQFSNDLVGKCFWTILQLLSWFAYNWFFMVSVSPGKWPKCPIKFKFLYS